MLAAPVVALVVLVGLGTACGNDDTSPATAPGDTTTTETAPPGAGVDDPEREARHAVVGFMDARVAGSGAEAYLTDQAAESIGDDSTLYGVTGYEVGELLEADANSFEVTVEVVSDDGERSETLFVGPGEVGGELAPFAIRGIEAG